MSMEATIEVTGLRKRLGPAVALDGMSFTVLPGRVTGLVGPNGAGKSTAMRVILGLDAADAGSTLVGGQPYRSLRHPLSHVGALLDAAALQPGLGVLAAWAAAARLTADDARCRALFASSLQPSDAPGADVAAEAIRVTVQQLGTDGCIGRMAQEFGDHPEAAAARMRWVRSLLI
jgi:ABC-type branched-subunit amino acid transport system ATPase component